MTHIRIALLAAILTVSISGSAHAASSIVIPTPKGGGCETSARALLEAAYLAADAEAWSSIAACAQDPTCDLAGARATAASARRAARAQADAQLDARLAACTILAEDYYTPATDPLQFTAEVDNPWVSLIPGRTLIYAKRTADGLERIEVETRSRTVEIAGVACRETIARQTLDGVLVEETQEWFAQQIDGSVWCFGESTRRYDSGFLAGTEGSWRAGTDGARPGVLVPGSPTGAASFRRALALGCVEDVRRVVATEARVTVAAGDFGGAIHVEEWDPLEPLELLIEILVPGLGLVAEVDLHTGERLELIQVLHAPL